MILNLEKKSVLQIRNQGKKIEFDIKQTTWTPHRRINVGKLDSQTNYN